MGKLHRITASLALLRLIWEGTQRALKEVQRHNYIPSACRRSALMSPLAHWLRQRQMRVLFFPLSRLAHPLLPVPCDRSPVLQAPIDHSAKAEALASIAQSNTATLQLLPNAHAGQSQVSRQLHTD